MGTNYYLKDKPACAHCGRGASRGLHIGKSSAGWTFGLRVYRDPACNYADVGPILSLDAWIPLFERFGVIDEFDHEHTAAEMIAEITVRTWRPDKDGYGALRRHHEMAMIRDVEFPWGANYDLIHGEFE